MAQNNLSKPLFLSEYDYAWDEGMFWDEVLTAVFPRRASSSPRKEINNATARNAPATSFDDFQESVNDAWDLGDDEFCVISGKQILSTTS